METQKNPDLVEGFQAGLRICQEGIPAVGERSGVGQGHGNKVTPTEPIFTHTTPPLAVEGAPNGPLTAGSEGDSNPN